MRKGAICALSSAFLLSVVTAGGQTPTSDPLSSTYLPVIDTNPADYPSNIWMTDSLVKVMQNGGSPGTNHWITIYTTENEIQSFQVHVQAGATPINALSVTMSDLVNAQTGTHISAASTDIVVYREAYENVTIPTATGSTYLNATGNIPDILIPAVDPYYHQTTTAFPFTVAAGNNQSIWVDVHTPSNAPSGYYSGTVTVSSGGTVLAAMPVIYAVWDWQMPSTASLPSVTFVSYGGFCLQVYGPTGCVSYPGSLGSADYGVTMANVDAAAQMLDNRYSLSGITNIFPGSESFEPTNGSANFDLVYGPLLSGTPAHVSTILPGAKLTTWPLSLLPSQVNGATFQNFQSHFASKGWVAPFYPLMDEPNPNNPAVWMTLIANGNQANSFTTPVIPNEVTTDIVTAGKYNALNTIDLMVVNVPVLEPGGGYPMQSLTTYQTWLAGSPSRSFWAYQSCSDSGTCTNGVTGPEYPASPNTYANYNIDGTPVANRVMEWQTYLHGQTGELYYYIDICDGPGGVSTQCGYPAAGSSYNPLVSDYYAGGWGDGTLMYPGSSSYVGTTIPIWLPSMRLKYIRDGMQDYEYLHALDELGYGSISMMQLQSFITNSYTFNNDPAALEGARMALGTQLHQLTLYGPSPSSLAPPPVISNIGASGVTTSSAAISWVTNTNCDSQVSYGTTTSYGQYSALNSSLVTNHSVALSSLAAATLYHYSVQSRDSSGNWSASGDNTFTTAAVPPVISAVAASDVTTSSAVITWITTTQAGSQVNYGLTSSYGQTTTLSSSLTTSHSVALSSLAPTTVYHYQVLSADGFGNLVVSADSTFTTETAPSPTGGPGGIGLVQHTVAHGLSIAFAGNVTAGDLIAVSFSGDQGVYPIASISDTQGNTFNKAIYCLASAGVNGEIWYAKNARGGADTLTIQAAGGGNVAIAEFSRVDPVNALDSAKCNASPVGSTYDTGPVTTAYANDLLYAAIADGGGLPAGGAGYTPLDTNIWNWEFGDEYGVAPSPGAYSATFGIGASLNNGAVMVAAFKQAASAPAAPSAIAVVQHTAAHGLSLTFPESVKAGDFIAVSFSGDQGNYPIASISDTQGNTYIKALSCLASAGVNGEIWFAKNVPGGLDTLTIQATGGGYIGVAEFSGIDATNPLDGITCNPSPAGPTSQTGLVTTNYSGDLLYGAIADGSGLPSQGAGYALLDTGIFNWEFGHEFEVSGPAGPYAAAFGNQGSGNDGAIMLAAFKPAGTTPVLPGSIAMVQHAAAHGLSLAFERNVTAGDLIAVSFSGDQGNYPIASISDSQGNLYLKAISCLAPAGVNAEIWYANGVSGGADTLTIHAAGGGNVGIAEFNGVAAGNALDAVKCNTSPTGTIYDAGPVSTQYGNELLYAAIADGAGLPTAGSEFTLLDTEIFNWEFGDEYRIAAVAGSYDVPFDNPGYQNAGAVLVATFVPAGAAQYSSEPGTAISNVTSSNVTSSAAVISWATNTLSNSQVSYGTTASYGRSSPLNSSLLTSHSVSLASLAPGTLYHYQVESTDASGSLALSGDNTFTTLAAPPVPANTNSIQLVQHAGGHGLSLAFPGSVASGDFIAVSFSGDQGNYPISSISDTQGNTYAKAVSCLASAGVNGEIWFAKGVVGGPNAITIQAQGGGNIGIAEFNGVDPSNPLDGAACNTTPNGQTYTTGPVTANASDLLYASIVDGGGMPAAGVGYTLLDTGVWNWEFGDEYSIAAASPYQATFGIQANQNNGAVLIAAFKPASGASVPPPGINMVQHQGGHGLSLPFPGKVTAGNLIAVSFSGDQGNYPITSISDTLGNTYVKAISCLASAGVNAEIWYAKNVYGGADTLTIHASGGGNAGIAEFSGLDILNPVDVVVCNNSTAGPTSNTGPLTTAFSNELLYSVIVDGGGIPTAGSDFTLLDAEIFNWEFGHEFRIAPVTGVYEATFDTPETSTSGAIAAVTFKPAS